VREVFVALLPSLQASAERLAFQLADITRTRAVANADYSFPLARGLVAELLGAFASLLPQIARWGRDLSAAVFGEINSERFSILARIEGAAALRSLAATLLQSRLAAARRWRASVLEHSLGRALLAVISGQSG